MKCGKFGHYAKQCLYQDVTYFNFRKQGHITRSCTFPKNEQYNVGGSSQCNRLKIIVTVLTISGVEASYFESRMQVGQGEESSEKRQSRKKDNLESEDLHEEFLCSNRCDIRRVVNEDNYGY
ncbi:hypothetical protein CR513_54128, partial [Mucuna pruriens]